MGIFSSKKTVYVSSSAYNLAGEEEDRVDIAQYTVLQAVMQNRSIAQSLTRSILNGAGIKLKSAYNYARDHYAYGVPDSNVLGTGSVNPAVLVPILQSENPGYTISVLTSYISAADYEFWAERYLTETYGYDRITKVFDHPPTGAVYNAIVTYGFNNGVITFILMNPDTSTVTFTHAPADFASGKMYVHAAYRTGKALNETVVTSTRPATAGEVNSETLEYMVTTSADETIETSIVTVITIAGDTATVVVTTTGSILSRSQYFTYQLSVGGSHPTLDALLNTTSIAVPYYPAIPLRVNNVDFTSDAKLETALYKTSEKMLKKSGIKIQDLAKKLNDNENIKDIDFAFVVYGVSIRSQTEAGKRYLFAFMEHLMTLGSVTKAQFDTWNNLSASAKKKTTPATNVLQIYDSQDRKNNYDVKLQWQYITKTLVNGVIHAGANVGDVDSSMGGQTLFGLEQADGYVDQMVDSSRMYLRKQVSANTFEMLEVSGLYFSNFIYDGKAVEMSAHDAFTDADEEVGNGFLIPINRNLLVGLGGRWMTQLGMESTFMVVNAYQVVKKKWYQTGWFKILLIVVAIVLTVFFPPSGGLFGSISTALGVTAATLGTLTLLTLLAATLTVLAGMIIMNLLTPAFIDAFGETWGRILIVIASMYAAGQLKFESLSKMATLSAQSILDGITAVGKLYKAYAEGEVVGLSEELAKATEEYKAKMETLEEMTKRLLGTNNVIDLQGYIESTTTLQNSELLRETPTTFLGRTLLSGSDVVEMTQGLIGEFANISLDLRATA